MTILTDEVRKELMRPENLDWTLMSAVAGDDLRYGVQMLVDRLKSHKDDENQLTVDQIIELLSSLLKEHKESIDSVY